MTHLDKKHLERLAGVHSRLCISIFIPTHSAGEETLKGQDHLEFKQQLKQVRQKLEGRSLEDFEIDKYMQPLYDLMEDSVYWRHQKQGLAVFSSEDIFENYELPISVESEVHVANSFFLKPLMPMLARNGKFLLLTLELNKVQLYLMTEEGTAHVPLPKDTPARLEEAVGFDYEEKSLQFRSQQQKKQGSVFHGQGEGKEDRKDEILRFFRTIDQGVAEAVGDTTMPLMLAGLDYLLPIYRKANTYAHLSEKQLTIHPSDLQLATLHKEAWNLMGPYFEEELEEKKALFLQHQNSSRTSLDLEEVLTMAFRGNVDSLFLDRDFEAWGIYEPKNEQVREGSKEDPANVSLTNLAAIQVFLKGGKVYLLEKEKMPVNYSGIISLNRF